MNVKFTKMALAALALLTFAACSGGGSSPLPAGGIASNTILRKPLDNFGGTGAPVSGAASFAAMKPLAPVAAPGQNNNNNNNNNDNSGANQNTGGNGGW